MPLHEPQQWPLGKWMLGVSVLALAPLLVFAVLVSQGLTQSHRQAEIVHLSRQATGLAEAVDARFKATFAMADTLALSFGPQVPMAEMYRLAVETTRLDHGIASVALTAPDNRLLLLTTTEFGTPLPETRAAAATARLFRTGQRQVSDLFTGVTGGRLVTAHVPVRGPDGGVAYDLTLGLRAETFFQTLRTQPLPAGWVATIRDSRGVVVSTSTDPMHLVGTPSPFPMIYGLVSPRLVEGTVDDGEPAIGAMAGAAFGWTVIVAVPERLLFAPARRAVALTSLTGVGLLTLGVGAAWWLARRLTVRVTRVVMAADKLGRGENVDIGGSGVLELDACATALTRSQALLRQQEEALRANRDVLANVLETLPVGVWILNAKGEIIVGNPEGRRIWGGARYVGMEDFDQYKGWWHGSGERVGRDDWAATRAIRDGETSLREEVDIEGFDGIRRTILASAVPLRGAHGNIAGAVVLNEDITALKHAETELRTAKDMAERAFREKSRFIAAASHDLRQPVQSLLLFSSILSGRLADHPAGQVVANMQSVVATLKQLLDGLLDLSRLEAETQAPKSVDVAVGPLLAELAAEYEPRARGKGLSLVVVPSSATARSDPALLRRVVGNLLENAVKYTQRGGIVMGVRRRKDRLWIQVVDSGIGIAADQQGAIFREFHQIGNPERSSANGLGLGLSIVQRLAAALDGRIVVRSVEGRGSSFSVVVPAAGQGIQVDSN